MNPAPKRACRHDGSRTRSGLEDRDVCGREMVKSSFLAMRSAVSHGGLGRRAARRRERAALAPLVPRRRGAVAQGVPFASAACSARSPSLGRAVRGRGPASRSKPATLTRRTWWRNSGISRDVAYRTLPRACQSVEPDGSSLASSSTHACPLACSRAGWDLRLCSDAQAKPGREVSSARSALPRLRRLLLELLCQRAVRRKPLRKCDPVAARSPVRQAPHTVRSR